MVYNNEEEKIVAITGVTRGLGRALTKQFIYEGWKVAGCGISADMIHDLQKEFGPKHSFTVANVTNSDEINSWTNAVISTLGIPLIVINNAGVVNNPAPLWNIQPSEFNHVLAVNISGVFNVLHSFIPRMIDNKKGLIINISSGWGKEGEALFSPYCASKFAIEGLTQSLAKEISTGLTVVSLDPGDGINTDMLKKIYPDEYAHYQNPDDWAKKAVAYILNIKNTDHGKSLTVPVS